jgi:hypothetical protein
LELELLNLSLEQNLHSVSSWGEAALKLEETKELIRHASVATTSDLYGGWTSRSSGQRNSGELRERHRGSAGR